MSRYIISDTHIGHKNIHKFRGGYVTSEEHWEAALEGLRSIPKRATLFLLGDIVFTKELLDEVGKIPCRNKIMVCGNHDLYEGRGVTMQDLVNTYDKVYSLNKYKNHWLSHAPIHPMELRGKFNCHGHTHPFLMLDEDGAPDPRYRNVCVEYTGYTPITWEYTTSLEYHQECVIKWNKFKGVGVV